MKSVLALGAAPSAVGELGAWRRLTAPNSALMTLLKTILLFGAASALLFACLKRSPWLAFQTLWQGSFGSGFALSETLVKAGPVLFCALATSLPARLGLVSVGAEGQLVAGSITGTAAVLALGDVRKVVLLPVMLLAGALGGAAYGALAGALRARLRVNETIGTLLLNYLPPLLVVYLVYGPWKDPNSLGWPATISFPDGARFASYFGTRVHAGIALGVVVTLTAHVLLVRTRWGSELALLREGPLLARRAGLSFERAVLWVMALGGAIAGVAGMIETSVLESRLQAGIGTGAGYAGFLVAFLARRDLRLVLPVTLVVAGLGAAGDNLQLNLELPSSITHVLEGLLFAATLVARGSTTKQEEAS